MPAHEMADWTPGFPFPLFSFSSPELVRAGTVPFAQAFGWVVSQSKGNKSFSAGFGHQGITPKGVPCDIEISIHPMSGAKHQINALPSHPRPKCTYLPCFPRKGRSTGSSPISGGRLVAAASPADARLVAAETEFMQETDQQPMPGLSHSSAFRDEKLYRVEQIDQRPVEAARGLIATEFDEQCQSFLSLPNPRR
ncbi:hypothetical protein [Brucella pituitosa]|uniref:hypothetical protein n=1 Tax=Brucella pituitosa TaxID=571256 RepID=UPI000FE1BDAA|nr:hypothetical protein [Brucella pituitosa]